jgi:nucleoside-diphosphate-sugar epimerase
MRTHGAVSIKAAARQADESSELLSRPLDQRLTRVLSCPLRPRRKRQHEDWHRKMTDTARLQATQDDPRQRRPDITVAAQKIGWKPRYTVREGVSHVCLHAL